MVGMKKLFIVLLLLNCGCYIYAQQKKIDSLKHLLSISKSNASTVILKYKLAHSYLYYKPDSSFLLAHEGLTLAKKINFLEGQEGCYKEIGEAKQQIGNYPDAIQDYYKYLHLAEKLNLQFDIAEALVDIGFLYQDQEEYGPAIKYTLKAKKVIESIKNKSKITNYQTTYNAILVNVGFFYYKNNQLDSALIYEQNAYELSVRIHTEEYMGNILLNLGLIQEKINNKALAILYYRMSVQKSEAIDDYTALTDTYLTIADFYNLTNKIDSSIIYYKKALTTAKSASYNKGILTASTNLANLYGINNKELAYDYLKTATIAKDSLFNQEKVKQVQKLKYEEQVREQEIADLTMLHEEERKDNLQLSAIALFIPVFFLISLLLSKIRVHNRIIEFMCVLSILFLFEFFTLLIHPIVSRFSNHTPLIEFVIFVCLAGVMVPTHHHLTIWLKKRLTNLRKWEKQHLPVAQRK
jgi:tetratricopeptide (TPR) repeat protein